MTDFKAKSYGRNEEVASIFGHFNAGRDLSMPGPRRLGKSFTLKRLVDAGPEYGWTVVSVDVSKCSDVRTVFRELCRAISSSKSVGENTLGWIQQRLGQVLTPRAEFRGPWYAPFLGLDYESWFERLIDAMEQDSQKWAILIDELPIFLKGLHDKGETGVAEARNFMNLTSGLKQRSPSVRWLVTGSIGLDPLARAGNYVGVLAKYTVFQLLPLNDTQASDYLIDLATTGQLEHRKEITNIEASTMLDAVGWNAPYYIDRLAQQLRGTPTHDVDEAKRLVKLAEDDLLKPVHASAFGISEEHLRKHYADPDRTIAFLALAALANHTSGLPLNAILSIIADPNVTREKLRTILQRLDTEGFVVVRDWDVHDIHCAFRNLLLRKWWKRYTPQPSA